MPRKDAPHIPPSMIEWLEKKFPNTLPLGDFDLRTVDRKCGQQDVISFLRRVSEQGTLE